MRLPTHPVAGPLFMVVATGSYLVNDTMLKLATEGLPAYETLFLRGIAATLWGLPLLFLLGYGRNLRQIAAPLVVLRNVIELGAILMYVVALANMPIADASALLQITPLLMILGASIVFRERVGGVRMALIGLGFFGALLVAQPTLSGFSPYALLALANAVFSAARDLVGRRVPAEIPGMVVSVSAAIIVMLGAGVMHLGFESWVVPQPVHLLLIAGAGLFLIFGHFFIFMAYRVGQTAVVAPFYYFFTFWAVMSGLVVFNQFPNTLAVIGIALVVVSGIAVVILGERQRRLTLVA